MMTPLRSLVRLEHVGGAHKMVELVGFTNYAGGEAMLFWPSAGHYTVVLRDDGSLRELSRNTNLQAQWRVSREVLAELRESYAEWQSTARARGARGARRALAGAR